MMDSLMNKKPFDYSIVPRFLSASLLLCFIDGENLMFFKHLRIEK